MRSGIRNRGYIEPSGVEYVAKCWRCSRSDSTSDGDTIVSVSYGGASTECVLVSESAQGACARVFRLDSSV